MGHEGSAPLGTPRALRFGQRGQQLRDAGTSSTWAPSWHETQQQWHLLRVTKTFGFYELWLCSQKSSSMLFLVCFSVLLWENWASLVAQSVKNLPAVQETPVWSLGREDPLEKEMATHASILVWRISWTQEPGGLQSMESKRAGHDWATHTLRKLKVEEERKQNTPPKSPHPAPTPPRWTTEAARVLR